MKYFIDGLRKKQSIVLKTLGLQMKKRLVQSASERALSKFTWHESQKKLGKLLA